MAQLVEHNLAKVGVAGSSPVVRSIACKEPVLHRLFSYRWRSGQVVRQRPAKPLPPVRIRASPPGTVQGALPGRPVSFREASCRSPRCRSSGATARTHPQDSNAASPGTRPPRHGRPPHAAALCRMSAETRSAQGGSSPGSCTTPARVTGKGPGPHRLRLSPFRSLYNKTGHRDFPMACVVRGGRYKI